MSRECLPKSRQSRDRKEAVPSKQSPSLNGLMSEEEPLPYGRGSVGFWDPPGVPRVSG
jgi:hypothetical protein